MKFLSFPAIDRVNSIVHGLNAGDRRFSCKIAVFSLKSTSDERRQRRRIVSKVSNHLTSLTQQGISTITPIGDLSQSSIQKLLVHLISTLNITYPDYDFSSTTPDAFEATTFDHIRQSLDDDMLTLAEEIVDENLRIQLWNGLKEAISIHNPEEVSIFNYLHDEDNPLFTANRLWAKIYIIYNPTLKRAAIISCSCRSKILHSPALVPINGTFRNILDLDDYSLDLSRRQLNPNSDDDSDDDSDYDYNTDTDTPLTPYDDDHLMDDHYIDSDTDDWFGTLSANTSFGGSLVAGTGMGGGSIDLHDRSLDLSTGGDYSTTTSGFHPSILHPHPSGQSPIFSYHNHVEIIPLNPQHSFGIATAATSSSSSSSSSSVFPAGPIDAAIGTSSGLATSEKSLSDQQQQQQQYRFPNTAALSSSHHHRGFISGEQGGNNNSNLYNTTTSTDYSDFAFVPVTLDPKDLPFNSSTQSASTGNRSRRSGGMPMSSRATGSTPTSDHNNGSKTPNITHTSHNSRTPPHGANNELIMNTDAKASSTTSTNDDDDDTVKNPISNDDTSSSHLSTTLHGPPRRRRSVNIRPHKGSSVSTASAGDLLETSSSLDDGDNDN